MGTHRLDASGNLNRIVSDLNTLGVYVPVVSMMPQSVIEYNHIQALIQPTRRLAAIHESNVDSSAMRSDYGRTILACVEKGMQTTIRATPPRVCGAAEAFLARAVVHPTSEHQLTGPSVIIKKEEAPVAVIKNIGESTAYGIANVPEHGIYEHGISQPLNDAILPGSLVEQMGVGEVVSVDISAAGRFRPVRLASTAIDSPVRKAAIDTLQSDADLVRLGLWLSIGAVAERASEMLQDAIPFEREMVVLGDWER